ncbi:MAG: ATP-binding protein [Microvirga sp.]
MTCADERQRVWNSRQNPERAFDIFFTTEVNRIGLGLAICQSTINAHDGTIAASNHLDGNAQFSVRLPAPSVQLI